MVRLIALAAALAITIVFASAHFFFEAAEPDAPVAVRPAQAAAAAAVTPKAVPASRVAAPKPPQPAAPATGDASAAALWDDVIRLSESDSALPRCGQLMAKLAEAKKVFPPASEHWSWALQKEVGCLLDARQDGGALSAVAEALEAQPENVGLLRALAHAYYARRRCDMAQALAQQAVAIKPDWQMYDLMSACETFRTMSASRDGEQDESAQREAALALQQQAIDVAPDERKAFMRMEVAKKLVALGRVDEALRAGQQAIADGRNAAALSRGSLANMYVDYGEMLYRHGQRESGTSYMDEGIAMAPAPAFHRMLELRRKSVVGPLTDAEIAEMGRGYTIPDD